MIAGEAESRARILLGAFLIAAAGALAYATSFRGVFVFDDFHNLVNNPHLSPLWPPGERLWAAPGTGLESRPVAAFSFAVSHALGGGEPAAHHALNLAIHLAAALFLFGLVRRALVLAGGRARDASLGLALGTAALWVVHPLTSGAVTYVYQRCESLMGALLVATCYFALRAMSAECPLRWQAAAAATCLAGAGAKETMVVAPLLVLALDALLVSKSVPAALRNHARLYAGLALSWAAILVLLLTRGAHAGSVGFSFDRLDAWDYLRAQAAALVLYARLALWPDVLVFDYGWPIPRRPIEWMPPAFAVLAALGATAWALLRRSALALCGAWFFLILAPSSSFLPVVTEVVVEHRMYLPLAGLILLAVLALWRALPGWLACVAVVLAVAGLGARTAQRGRDYHSEERLWRLTVQQVPDNPRAHYSLGDVVRAKGRRNEALMHYEQAVRLDPEEPEWRLNLGVLLFELGELERAFMHLDAALQARPDWALAHYNLGRARVRAGDPERAVQSFREALRLSPQWLDAARGLGIALARAGRRPEALRALREVVAARPRDVEALVELGELLVSAPEPGLRDGEQALKLARRAQRITQGREARSVALVAAAQAETGDFAAAAATARRGLQLAGPDERAEHARRLELYLDRRTLAESF